MKNINWEVRFKHKPFLLALFSAILLLASQVAQIFGFDISAWGGELTKVFETFLGVLVLLGVVIDPTTSDLKDSEKAMKYKELK